MAAQASNQPRVLDIHHAEMLADRLLTWIRTAYAPDAQSFQRFCHDIDFNPMRQVLLVAIRAHLVTDNATGRLEQKADTNAPVRVSSSPVPFAALALNVVVHKDYEVKFEPMDYLPANTAAEDIAFWQPRDYTWSTLLQASAVNMQRKPHKIVILCHFEGDVNNQPEVYKCTFGVDVPEFMRSPPAAYPDPAKRVVAVSYPV